MGGADLAIVHRVGKGRAVYLNALLDHEAPRATPGAPCCERSSPMPASVPRSRSPIPPAGRSRGSASRATASAGTRSSPCSSGQLDVKTSFGRDGVTVYENAEGRVVRHEVDVALPRAAHVTNARTGEALGETARLRTTLTAGDALVLALGPPRSDLRLDGPATAQRGEAAAFTASAPSAEKRLLRWHVRGPDGAFRPEYARVSLEEAASARFVLPSALNDAHGGVPCHGHRRAERGLGRGDPAPRVTGVRS